MKKILLLLITIGLLLQGNAVKAAPEAPASFTAKAVSATRDDQPLYMVVLTVAGTTAAKYIIERQTGQEGRTKVAELTPAMLARNNYQFADTVGLIKHTKYQYFVYVQDESGQNSAERSANVTVENISPCLAKDLAAPKIAGQAVTFTLGPKADCEGDTLEYWLYTRIPGGGCEIIIKRWKPTVDNQTETVSLNQCEYKLSCIETDRKIGDRKEITLVGWSSLNPTTANQNN